MDDISREAHDIMTVRYLAVSALVYQTYDYLISLDDEIRLVWSHKMTIRQIPFLLNRYMPFATTIASVYYIVFNNDINACKGGFVILASSSITGMLVGECSVFLRADAVWGHNRFIRALLIITIMCASAGVAYASVVHITHNETLSYRVFSGCLYVHGDRKVWIILMSYVICDCLALVLLLARAFSDPQYANSPLMRLLYRDGLMYFTYMLALTIANVVLEVSASLTLSDAFLVPESVLINIICTHMLLRIRDAREASVPVHRADEIGLGLPLRKSSVSSRRQGV